MEPQGTLNKHQNCYKPKFRQIFPKKMSQSRFLEASLVRQADGELKKYKMHIVAFALKS